MVEDAGLKLPSAHVAFEMDNDLGPILAEAKALGVEYATSSFLRKLNDPGRMSLGNISSRQPALPPMGIDAFQKMAARMNQIGKRAQSFGLKYAYHNHNFEFEALPDGKLGYDVLLRETDDSLVSFEVDCGWMVAAGVSPVEYFKRYPRRFRMLHVKDFKPVPRPTTDMVGPDRPDGVELGRGFIDYKPILAASQEAGVDHIFAEQEAPYTRPQLDSAKVSYAFLRSISLQ
jgi:sugar phosphate isomerase/epimerase